jgi:hypothetical protein
MGDLAAWWTLAWVVEGSFAEESFAAYHALVPSILRGLLPQPVLAAAGDMLDQVGFLHEPLGTQVAEVARLEAVHGRHVLP